MGTYTHEIHLVRDVPPPRMAIERPSAVHGLRTAVEGGDTVKRKGLITVTTQNHTYTIDPVRRVIKGHPTYCPGWRKFSSVYTYGRALWVEFADGMEYEVDGMRRTNYRILTSRMKKYGRLIEFPPLREQAA